MKISIIVLAAGTSARMGRPKPLLEFDGRTCLSLVLSACLGSRAEGTTVVLGSEAEMIRSAIEAPEFLAAIEAGRLRSVVNRRFDRGQTSSLKSGLEALPAGIDGFVVFPVDHPLVTSNDIDALIGRFAPRPRGRTIFVAAYENGRGHPVLFSIGHRTGILELGDDEPLHGFLRVREGEIERVCLNSPGVIMSMNTPEEYQKILSAYRARLGAS
ncbi:MAG: NTP transferase domain-containing protein [Acidobacteriota bacterium]